jgi:hypothetical protein
MSAEEKEKYVANFLMKMSQYPDYVASSIVFYRKTYGDSFAESVIKLMKKTKK